MCQPASGLRACSTGLSVAFHCRTPFRKLTHIRSPNIPSGLLTNITLVVHRDYNQLPPKAPNLITLPSIDTLGGPGFHRLPPITSMLPNPAPPPNHQKPFRTEARKSKKQRAWVSGTCALCGPVTTPVFRRPKVATPSDKLVPDRICNACSMFIRRKAKTKGTEDKKKANEKDETKQS